MGQRGLALLASYLTGKRRASGTEKAETKSYFKRSSTLCHILHSNVDAISTATRNWGLIYNWLDDGTLAHPSKLKAIAETRIKTDKISDDILADLFHIDFLSRDYALSKQT